jgi:hypothetical protein
MQQLMPAMGGGSGLGAQQRMSHGMILQGGGGTAVADTSQGTLTLPAGGPWTIYAVHALIARKTATAAESNNGHFFLRATVGDLDPNPSPSHFPMGSDGSFLGATADAPVDQLHFFDVNFNAPGKAVLEILYRNRGVMTVAPAIITGIVFGLAIPFYVPVQFMDSISGAISSTTEASLGTITLAERATRITHIGGTLAPDAGLTAGEEIIGYFRLASDDVKLEPSLWPFSCAIGAGLGALIQCNGPIEPFLIPVDIPVPGGARVDVFADLITALTLAVRAEVFIGYEMG